MDQCEKYSPLFRIYFETLTGKIKKTQYSGSLSIIYLITGLKTHKGPSCNGEEASENPMNEINNLLNGQSLNGAGLLSQLSKTSSMRSIIGTVNLENNGHINVDFNLGK